MDQLDRLRFADSARPPAKAAGGNHLLEALSADSRSLLQPFLREREFAGGSVLWDPGEAHGEIYFPNSGLVCIALPAHNGRHVEVASVSREGAAGVPDAASKCTTTRAMVMVRGTLCSVPAEIFSKLEQQSAELASLAALARHWVLLQSQRLAACNALHSVETRFCRWLMFAADRMDCDEISATQEDISGLLGVRRTTLTLVAQKLQSSGSISCSRGKVAIRDRKRLEALTCGCYAALARSTWPAYRLSAIDASDTRASRG